jgi:hypothetical protein
MRVRDYYRLCRFIEIPFNEVIRCVIAKSWPLGSSIRNGRRRDKLGVEALERSNQSWPWPKLK